MTTVIDRPTPKSVGKTAYERYRRKQIAYGRWQRWADPEPVREHILALRRNGVGRDTLGRLAAVDDSHISKIACRRVTKVTIDVAERILAVTNPKPHVVDATGARRRLQALGAIGWDQSTLGPRIGWQVGAINLIVRGRRTRIEQATNERIHQMYEELSATPAPDGYASKVARRAAQRNGWVPPLAWDDDTIDDPHAQPNLGDPTGDLVDEVAVRRALAGDRIRLTPAEKVHAFRAGYTAGMTTNAIAAALHLSGSKIQQLAAAAKTA
ncbi:hypothetical protein QTQ03_16580 [Micromonospora sp. WMMA1363]|uniref:hypothetical protein n=1 Tax=Micromonospora sp. WMMA1363 TaxID=3053985 RepID=UPI00259CF35F|nr:hypothetical protein [Micromonospora sp. WMMA1363]MDM4721135.1 hypothetical protein [Micromonospora sp. WMMA1363]